MRYSSPHLTEVEVGEVTPPSVTRLTTKIGFAETPLFRPHLARSSFLHSCIFLGCFSRLCISTKCIG